MQEFWLYHSIQEVQPIIITCLLAIHGWPPSADRRTERQGWEKWPKKVAILIHVICFMWGWPKEEVYRSRPRQKDKLEQKFEIIWPLFLHTSYG
jgi:hypothetical protein